ncbi:MAG: hypothetical protein R3272_13840 [Candidatus Promineifilaceae bacterium]|nr:hypothetical protein [Candidatus Promineifilaceae bacterium]
MPSNKRRRASLSGNSPLDELFGPAPARRDEEEEAATSEERTRKRPDPAERTGAAPTAERDAVPVTAPPAGGEEVEPSPPPVLRQTTIMIYEDQSDWLDEACYLARRDGGSIVSKAAIIRALLDLAREYEVAFAGAQSDDELRQRLKETLGLSR